MSEEEREAIGKRSIELASDPVFQAQQNKLLAGLLNPNDKAADDSLSDEDHNQLMRDLLILKEIDPAGYLEAMELLEKKANAAS